MPNQKSSKSLPAARSLQLGSLFGESTRKTGLDADWNEVEPNVLLAIVWGVSSLGGSVTLGVTRNGQAYTCKVYIGAPYDALYWDGDADGREQMRAWADRLIQLVAENA